ncbi:required for drug-induced death protein 1-like [Menidia menidia]
MKPKSLHSRLFDRNSVSSSGATLSVRAAKYQRHVDCADQSEKPEQSPSNDGWPVAEESGQCERPREMHFAFTQERYEQLMDDETREERKKRKKESYKKVKKNVGKALRSTWKCLKLGLYNFAFGYSTPVTIAAAFVPDFHPGRDRT